ncbi:uncharacterized protein MELLADRAFT_105377 [Melampsora larici-populina 98AG31]|uniref:Secreted protein n=1 Tax=Melampsora larici-populina (strain 98AG31 / pathotype 3-4-7) TaxID=747676 RepID=F4RHX7_MELLP|nr:uncharacterized protein MELLADRAFT_105377 [Melampsora larici-populina 98AG31]EGG08056.1 hypothetical protein MELLADRAFT_105377 [Melampsora larici-populina 98AG31]
MDSSLFERLILFILFCHSFIHCSSVSKRELKRPESVLGEVYEFVGYNEVTQSYLIDYSTPYQVPLEDIRALKKKPTLKTHGFTYVSGRPVTGIEKLVTSSDEHRDALNADAVKLVKELMGSKPTVTFGTGFRDLTKLGPMNSAPVIHSDLSPEGAAWKKFVTQNRLFGSTDPDQIKFAKHLKEGKDVVILNVWRPIRTVKDNHLGFCKWDTLLKEDALPRNIKPTEASNALQPWKYRPGQRWYYLSEQQPDEAFIFMQHDSTARDGHGINVAHASINLKGHKDPFTRASFETKVMVIVDPPIIRRLSRIWERIKSSLTK